MTAPRISNSSAPSRTRPLTNLTVTISIGFFSVLLFLSVNFSGLLSNFLSPYSALPNVSLVTNILFLGVATMSWIAYRRWREETSMRDELENILTSIRPDTLIVITPDRKIVVCNEALSRMFGYAPDEILQKTTDKLYYDRRSRKHRRPEVYEALEKDGFHVGTATGIKKNGKLIPLEIISGGLKDKRGAVLLLRDISDRVRADERRADLEERMQQRQKLESLGVLAGGIAHDFNNLLAGILGNADLLATDLPADSPMKLYTNEIMGSARRAAELCSEMLAYSGKGKFVVEPLLISNIIDEMRPFLQMTVSKKARLQFQLDGDLAYIEGDRPQVRQIIINLITNASDALEEKEGAINIRTGSMNCDESYLLETYFDELPAPGEFLFIEVSDTGVGMPNDTLAKIFEPFFTTKFTGRGLGLASVQGIIRGHGGALKVVSEPTNGTTFTVLFPRSEYSPPMTENDPETHDIDWHGTGTVLVIDDEPGVIRLATDMLERMGYEVIAAEDGRKGLEAFWEHEDALSLVLLDLTMPELSGEEVFREIKRIKPKIRVLISSGYSEDEVAAAFTGSSPDGFLQKPYESTHLREKIIEIHTNTSSVAP